MKNNYEIRVLLMDTKQGWVAQCLEYDFVAQGKTIKETVDKFSRAFAAQILIEAELGKTPLEDFTRAPIEYWDMFEAGYRVDSPTAFRVPESFMPGGVGLAQHAIYA